MYYNGQISGPGPPSAQIRGPGASVNSTDHLLLRCVLQRTTFWAQATRVCVCLCECVRGVCCACVLCCSGMWCVCAVVPHAKNRSRIATTPALENRPHFFEKAGPSAKLPTIARQDTKPQIPECAKPASNDVQEVVGWSPILK